MNLIFGFESTQNKQKIKYQPWLLKTKYEQKNEH